MSVQGLPTQVHVGGLLAVGVGDVLVDGVQDLLLHLADGVTVQHLHLDLWALLILRVDTVHHLGGGEGGAVEERRRELNS